MADDPSITGIAGRLYGLPLAEFTAARDAESRALKDAGDSALATRVKRFKKPSAGAHLVNLLVRDGAALLEDLRDLGGRLRAAQADPDPGRLRALDQERRTLVARSVSAATAIAARDGGRATDASLRDVEQTVWAAVVDPGGFATMRAGLLVRALSPSGFGSVDLADASALPVDIDEAAPLPQRTTASTSPPRVAAVPVSEPAPEPADPAAERARLKALADARAEVEAAEAELDRTEQSRADASQRVDDSQLDLTELQDELAELRERITTVEEAIHEGRTVQTTAKTSLRQAEKERRAAASVLDRARSRLDDLTEEP